jgi:hypothetical protein
VTYSAAAQTGPAAFPASYTVGTVTLQGLKRPERGVVHALQSSAEVLTSALDGEIVNLLAREFYI